MAEGAATIAVVVLHSPESGRVLEQAVQLPVPAIMADALRAAAVTAEEGGCGIWGRLAAMDTLLQAGDRIECYRPLTVDPKVARRERFAKQGARSTGLFAKRRVNSKAGY